MACFCVLVAWLSKLRLADTTLSEVSASQMPLYFPGSACELLRQVLYLTIFGPPSQSAMPFLPFDSHQLSSTTLSLSPLCPKSPMPLPLLPMNLFRFTLTRCTPAQKNKPFAKLPRAMQSLNSLSDKPPPG